MWKTSYLRLFALLLVVLVMCTDALDAAKAAVVKVKVMTSSENPNFEGYRALDGNPGSMWHTQFSGGSPGHPHDLVVDLGKACAVSGFCYVPRNDGIQNGTIKDYEVYVTAKQKQAGEPAAKGVFARAVGENRVMFPAPVTGRFFRLRALSEVNGNPWASAAELRILSGQLKFVAGPSSGYMIEETASEEEMQYEVLRRDIMNRAHFKRVADQTFHPAALIHDEDRDPLDVIVRRTKTLLLDLASAVDAPDLSAEAAALAALEKACRDGDVEEGEARLALFKKALVLRRRIAFANPLLNFDEILFLKRHRSTFSHMCDQYYGINAVPGGGLFVLSKPFGEKAEVRNILADSVVTKGRLKGQRLEKGSFLSPDLSWDGKTVAFAYVESEGSRRHDHHTDPSRGHWDRGWCYHVFKAGVDGSGLEQLTDGTWNDFDPCWLPNGRIVFISERRGGYLRCGRVCPNYTLYDMAPDGSDILCLSPHETNEWHPSVTHNGMIIYTRWDYIDRHGCVAHLPWITTPDGRDSRAVHGNFAPREKRADMELDIQAIPGSHRFVATGAPHHGQAFGSLVMFDPRVEDDDAMAPVKRLTPEIKFPETQGGSQVYGTAWPLSEKYYLCVYDPTMRSNMGMQGRRHVRGRYGIYLLDVFGNKELLYKDPEIAIQNPIPLRPRKMPPVVPAASQRLAENKPETGTLAVVDVYDSMKDWPEGTSIKAIRVYKILPMSVPSGAPPHEVGLRLPTAGDSVNPVRHILGTVPVEKDGSAYFTVPAMRELFFQALDKDGRAVQSMRSATYVQPGENLVCQGCHENRYRTQDMPLKLPLAFRRKPSSIKPEVDGTNPYSYPRLVQPVLNKHCVSCHEKNPKKAPRLDDELIVQGRKRFFASYFSLAPKYGFWQYGNRFRTTPGKFGAQASKLYQMLKKGHHKVKLSPEEMHRIVLWLDSSSLFYGVYEKEGGEAQLRGEVVMPTLE